MERMETISAAKKALEKKIISNAYVTSVGTRQRDGEQFIQVGVSEQKYVSEIQSLLTEGKWKGHQVEIIVNPLSEPH